MKKYERGRVMKLTFINHSGIALEMEKVNFVIDYYRGNVPALDKSKKLFVLSSHGHGDHFNPEIFKLFRDFEDVTYILSFDIEKMVEADWKRHAITEAQKSNIKYVFPEKKYEFDFSGGKIELETFVSTDEGVAFLLTAEGKNIYHAGDLHWWAWLDNEPDYDKWMKETFFSQIRKMKGKIIDLAFVPVDLRLEKNVFIGADAVMRELNVKRLYPIHMFGSYDITKKFRESEISRPYRDRIFDFDYDGQCIELDL